MIVDAAMTELVRPTLYGAHQISALYASEMKNCWHGMLSDRCAKAATFWGGANCLN